MKGYWFDSIACHLKREQVRPSAPYFEGADVNSLTFFLKQGLFLRRLLLILTDFAKNRNNYEKVPYQGLPFFLACFPVVVSYYPIVVWLVGVLVAKP